MGHPIAKARCDSVALKAITKLQRILTDAEADRFLAEILGSANAVIAKESPDMGSLLNQRPSARNTLSRANSLRH